MDELIPQIPAIPLGLRQASREGILIPFVGAGASKLAGCPNWTEFADGALHWMIDKGKFSHGRLAQIQGLNPRVKLSIALRLQEEMDLQIDFLKLLHPSDCNLHTVGLKLYECISKLGTSFVTTNYDRWLDEDRSTSQMSAISSNADSLSHVSPTRRRVIYKTEDFTLSNLSQSNTVIHLHGTVDAPDSMIVTTKHYVKHYANDRTGSENRVLTFLDSLFNRKTVLFIGYGLEELEILEYVISNVRPTSSGKQTKANHYLLQGFFRHEYELMRSLDQYYISECGIQLLPFCRDQNNWNQLLNVLEFFAREIPASPLLISQKAKEMKYLLYGNS